MSTTDDRELVSLSRYPTGKMVYYMKGPKAWAEAALKALETPGACQVMPYVWEQRFAEAMRAQGAPEEAIAEFLRSVSFDEEHCVMRDSW